ncbi:MAG: hypothetical protein AABX07_03595 [Nanoarchaeota archaeon]
MLKNNIKNRVKEMIERMNVGEKEGLKKRMIYRKFLDKPSMLIIKILIVFIFFIQSLNFISATSNLYWVGVSDGNWSNSSNWASSSGGAGEAGIPNATTDVIFDSANLNNSIIDANFIGVVYSINVSNSYNGTITSNLGWNNSLNITENFLISNGTLKHGANSNAEVYRLNIIVGGNFTLESRSFINLTGLGATSQIRLFE